MNKKKITIEEYNKKMDKIIAKNLSVPETLMEMLEEASRYIIVESTKKRNVKKDL